MRMLAHAAPARAGAHGAEPLKSRAGDPSAPSLSNLLAHRFTKACGAGVASAALAPKLMEPETWTELRAIQAAIIERYAEQQHNWAKGCATIADESLQIGAADTMAKLVEQQFNVLAQWGRLISVQTTNLMVLQEQIETDFSYWVSKKVA